MTRTKKSATKKSGKKGDPQITKETSEKTEVEETPEETSSKKRKATPKKSDQDDEEVTPRTKRRGRPTKAEQFMKRKQSGDLDKTPKRPDGYIEKITITEFLQSYEQSALDFKRTYEYEDEIRKMMHSFGDIAHPQIETANLLESLASIYLKHTMDQLVQETLRRHIRKNKQKKLPKNFYKQRVDLDEVTLNLAADKRARVKDVVSFLRRNKKIERTTQAVEEGWFEDEQDYDEDAVTEELADLKEDKVTLDNFWDSIVVGEAQDKAKERKLERLKYRDNFTKTMTTQEYLYFADCTKVSFTRPAKRTKFMGWSKLNTYPISFGNECVDVIGQLVYEFVEEIVRGVLNSSSSPQELAKVGISVPQILEYVKSKNAAFEMEEKTANDKEDNINTDNDGQQTITTTTTTTTTTTSSSMPMIVDNQ